MYDLVIADVDLVDGSGSSRRRSHVALTGDRIALSISAELPSPPGRQTISGNGCVLCPGFIDVHSHDDFAALLSPELSFKTLQGVTSEVVGNCGIGAAPFPGAEDWLEKLHPGKLQPDYVGYAGYFEALLLARPSANIAVLAGHGALRNAGAPSAPRPLLSGEKVAVLRALEEALSAGVIGLSAGLIYQPGVFADRKELVELCTRLRPSAPLFAVHLRSEADELLTAVQEAIEIAEEAGVGLQLSHHKAHGRNNWGKVQKSLALVEQARARGLDVFVDLYPYTAGSTVLQAVMDRGGLSEGPALGRLLAEDIVVASAPGAESFEGKSLADLALVLGVSPSQAAERVLADCPGAWVVVHAMSEEDVQTVLAHPLTLFGSDGLPTEGGRPHPRLYGTFPRILGHYCRDLRIVTLEDAIFRMTGASARRFGLTFRGEIKEGYFADLVLFDPSRIAAGSTFEEPRAAPLGIEGVWVNGERVVDRGRHTGARPGRPLRREL